MAKISGQFQHIRRLLAARDERFQREVGQAMYVGGDLIAKEAQRSITTGSISGAGHIPSAPGQPPNADTRQLDTNIRVTRTRAFEIEIASNAEYSTYLEFGTSRMAERPFMKPASDKMTPKALALVAAAVKRATGG
jgi:HK97 gp10 family phage protein